VIRTVGTDNELVILLGRSCVGRIAEWPLVDLCGMGGQRKINASAVMLSDFIKGNRPPEGVCFIQIIYRGGRLIGETGGKKKSRPLQRNLINKNRS